METYIALLRGINVGGKNKVAMPILKKVFEEQGFSNVVTYINSGNVVFSSEVQDIHKLIQQCEAIITERFMLTVPVAVLPANQLAEAVIHAPIWWNADKDTIHYAIFVLPPTTIEDVFAAVGDIDPQYECIAYHDQIIFWSAHTKTFSKSRWSKIASSSVNNSVTIRNANTVNKLLQLADIL